LFDILFYNIEIYKVKDIQLKTLLIFCKNGENDLYG